MDSRLVVSFLDLPREADISALVLRFGGECELVWLNALAVFSDPIRAATALRRLDHSSIYHGAVVVIQDAGRSANNAWGGGATVASTAPISKGNPWKKVVTEEEDLWSTTTTSTSEISISATGNRWTILDGGGVTSHSSSAEWGSSNEVAEDWEKAYLYWKNEHRLMCSSETCTAAERDRYEKSIYKAQRNGILCASACLLYWCVYRICKYYKEIQRLEQVEKRIKGE